MDERDRIAHNKASQEEVVAETPDTVTISLAEYKSYREIAACPDDYTVVKRVQLDEMRFKFGEMAERLTDYHEMLGEGRLMAEQELGLVFGGKMSIGKVAKSLMKLASNLVMDNHYMDDVITRYPRLKELFSKYMNKDGAATIRLGEGSGESDRAEGEA